MNFREFDELIQQNKPWHSVAAGTIQRYRNFEALIVLASNRSQHCDQSFSERIYFWLQFEWLFTITVQRVQCSRFFLPLIGFSVPVGNT